MKTSIILKKEDQIKQFLNLFGEDIIISKGSTKFKNYISIEEAIKFNQAPYYYDIYFRPNQGGTRDSEINKFNCLFIDLDTGRDPFTNEYLDYNTVKAEKKRFIKKINSFIYSPSIITETRNGYHCYWLLKDNDTIIANEWRTTEELLVKYFDADVSVKNESRMLRLPYLMWNKKHTGLEPFNVKVEKMTNTKYCLTEIFALLKSNELIEKCSLDGIKYSRSFSAHNSNTPLLLLAPKHISKKSTLRQAIATGDIDFIVDKLSIDRTNNLQFETIYQANEWLKSNINMRDFLDIQEHKQFSCIFHEDEKPSATILTPNQSEHEIYMYVCLSSNCSFTSGNIIDCVAVLQNTNYRNAYQFLYKLYNIKVNKSNWYNEQVEMLEYNKYLIYNGDFQNRFPDTYKLINRYPQRKHLLQFMLDMAKYNICEQSRTDKDGHPIFFVSLRYMAQYFGKSDPKRFSERITLLTALGLLNKIPDSDLPEDWFKKSKELQKQKDYRYSIQYYSIPDYTNENSINAIRHQTEKWITTEMRTAGLSYDCFALSYGTEDADNICPKSAGKELTESSISFINKMKSTLSDLVAKNNYATEKQMLESFIGYKGVNEKKSKMFLFSVLESLELERVRCSKEIRKKHKIKENISCNAYVIVRKKYSRKNK